jgi:hypothetical protein
MLILEMEQEPRNEALTLDRLLRNWWAKLKAWLWRQPLAEAQADKDTNESDRSASLIL